MINASVQFNTIEGNYIGTDVTGTLDLGNGEYGIYSSTAHRNTIADNVISGNTGGGIYLFGNATHTVTGNLIGVDAGGSNALGNDGDGLVLDTLSLAQVGGTGPGDINVISANGGVGILVQSSVSVTIEGNNVGTDAAGTAALGNGTDGVWVFNSNNIVIGGSAAGAGNVVAGSSDSGIEVGNSTGVIAQGNYVGTDRTAALNLGNTGSGIVLFGTSSGNLIGGTASGTGNVVAHSGNNGVYLDHTVGSDNSILGNTVFDSGGLGIELTESGPTWGVTANDSGDGDSGANDLQNFPVIAQASLNGTDLTLSGTLDTDGLNAPYRIEFFGNVSGTQDLTNGEGRTYLGSTTVTTDGSGDGAFSGIVLSGVTLAVGDYVTATATKIESPVQVGMDDLLAYGSTSEFAANIAIVPNNPPTDIAPNIFAVDELVDTSSGYSVGTLTTTDPDVGDTFTYSIVGGADALKFSIGGGSSDELILTDGTLDFETKSSYSVTVRTTDSGGADLR